MKKFSSAEKFVLLGGLILIVAIVVLGFAKKTLIDSKKEPFQAKEVGEVASTSSDSIDGITLKKDVAVLEAGKAVSEKAETYVKGSEEVVNACRLDVSAVNEKVPGTYKIVLTYNKKTMDIPVEVKDTTPPVITAANSVVFFEIDATSTVEEIKEFVNASAKDSIDGDIKEIKGWPQELPKVAGEKVYTLTAEDQSGNIGEKKITVTYTLKAAEQPETKENEGA